MKKLSISTITYIEADREKQKKEDNEENLNVNIGRRGKIKVSNKEGKRENQITVEQRKILYNQDERKQKERQRKSRKNKVSTYTLERDTKREIKKKGKTLPVI